VAFLAREPAAGEQTAFTAVPAAAVHGGPGAERVFVVAGDRLAATPVSVGRRAGSLVELLQGPAVGTRVATGPAERLRDGLRVAPGKP